MKKLLLTGLSLCLALIGFAQNNKPIVGIENFSGALPEAAISALRNNIVTNAYKTGRINIIDVNDQSEGTLYNAFLRGQIDDMTTKPTEITGSDGKKYPGLSGYVHFTLTLIDAGDGTVIRQEKFSGYGSGKEAFDVAMGAVDVTDNKQIKNFIMNAFPIGGKIVALGDADAKKAKTVYIDLGSNDGLTKGQKLEIFKEIDIAGEKSNKLIGELKIEEVMGGGRSLCKVTKNGEEVLSEINKGTTLPVETKEQKTNFLGF